jgi:hypothetical protein
MEDANIFGDSEIFMPKGKFESITRIQKRDLDQIGVSTSNGVPLLATVSGFHKQFQRIRTSLKGAGVDEELGNIKGLQEHEKLTAFQIKNQKELGQLIEKPIAKARMIDSYSGYQQMVQLVIKELAVIIPGDNRKNEEFLTKLWNTVSKRIIEDMVDVTEWEEDGSLRLLSTRIQQSREEVDLSKEVDQRTIDKDILSELSPEGVIEEDLYGRD